MEEQHLLQTGPAQTEGCPREGLTGTRRDGKESHKKSEEVKSTPPPGPFQDRSRTVPQRALVHLQAWSSRDRRDQSPLTSSRNLLRGGGRVRTRGRPETSLSSSN